MDFEKFIEEVKSRIKDFLPEKYADAEIYVDEQKKINSQYTGLTVVGKDITNPTINLEAFHGEYENGNFFVLPSSLHETIVVPNDGNMEYKALLAMVTEINATEVDKQDKLTDQVYHYDVTDKVFEKASRYEDRKQEKDKSHEKKSVLEKLEEKKDEAKATIGAKKTSYRDAVSL